MGILIVRQAGDRRNVTNEQVALSCYADEQGNSPLLVFVELRHATAQVLHREISSTVRRGSIHEIHFFRVNLTTGLVPFHGTPQSRRAMRDLATYFSRPSPAAGIIVRYSGCNPARPTNGQLRVLARRWELDWILVKIDQQMEYPLVTSRKFAQ
jgi:hypothetical protein